MVDRKIIYVEIDEEVASIFDKVKANKSRYIYIVVPKKASLFQSLINLKILKTKAQKIQKKIVLVTNDKIGKKLAEQIDFRVLEKIPNRKNKKERKISIEPIEAISNKIVSEGVPDVRSDKQKISIKDIVRRFPKTHTEKKITSKTPVNFAQPGKKFLIGIMVFSVILFFVITYVALPGATVSIKPNSEILEQHVNITLADYQKNYGELQSRKNSHMIPSYPVETIFEKTIVFETMSREFEGENAHGKIKIINTAAKAWPLVDQTQFESPDGVIFRIKNWVNVPAKHEDKNGEITVNVVADPFDTAFNVVGERGNIGPAKFRIRKLSAFNQQMIWGESEEPMTGGITKFTEIVKEEDLDTAKKKVEAELMESAKEFLKEVIIKKNRLNRSHLIMINDPNFFERNILEIRIPEDLVGKTQNNFEVYAKMKIKSIAFDYDNFLEILKRDLKSRVHPDMHLREDTINDQSISYKVIDENKATGRLKLSTSIKGVQEYTIEPVSESGLRFVRRIKDKVAGLNKKDAENFINNLPEVSDVSISLWPFWNMALPAVAENILIQLKEE